MNYARKLRYDSALTFKVSVNVSLLCSFVLLARLWNSTPLIYISTEIEPSMLGVWITVVMAFFLISFLTFLVFFNHRLEANRSKSILCFIPVNVSVYLFLITLIHINLYLLLKLVSSFETFIIFSGSVKYVTWKHRLVNTKLRHRTTGDRNVLIIIPDYLRL